MTQTAIEVATEQFRDVLRAVADNTLDTYAGEPDERIVRLGAAIREAIPERAYSLIYTLATCENVNTGYDW